MKYYVIEISKGDSKVAGKAIYEYETELDAVATFHQKLSTAMKSELYTSETITVMREDGASVKFERFVRNTAE